MKNGTRGSRFCIEGSAHQAAFNHIDVSKALHIIGMFMPKLALAAALAFFAAGFGAATGAVSSVARSQEVFSCERATEKNRST